MFVLEEGAKINETTFASYPCEAKTKVQETVNRINEFCNSKVASAVMARKGEVIRVFAEGPKPQIQHLFSEGFQGRICDGLSVYTQPKGEETACIAVFNPRREEVLNPLSKSPSGISWYNIPGNQTIVGMKKHTDGSISAVSVKNRDGIITSQKILGSNPSPKDITFYGYILSYMENLGNSVKY